MNGGELVLPYAKERIRTLQAELERLKESEFPYQDAKDALAQLEAIFASTSKVVDELKDTSAPEVVSVTAGLAVRQLILYLPLLGFILRSTNVRNAFEVFHPFLRLASSVLEPGVPPKKQTTRLLLSSEWEYSPFTYQGLPDLAGFVLIGTPAPESSNPLLLPLAGHELGHSLWASRDLASLFEPIVAHEYTQVLSGYLPQFSTYSHKAYSSIEEVQQDLLVLPELAEMQSWGLQQVEESFCDFVGLRIFGESYLYSFAYLLVPGVGERYPSYPPMWTRAENLTKAATDFGLECPSGYSGLFDDDQQLQPKNFGPYDALKLRIADEAVRAMQGQVVAKAKELLVSVQKSTPDEVDRIYRRLRLAVPAERSRSLADIVNAGWVAYHDGDFWKDLPVVLERKAEVLKELVLKNLEVFEFEQLGKDAVEGQGHDI